MNGVVCSAVFFCDLFVSSWESIVSHPWSLHPPLFTPQLQQEITEIQEQGSRFGHPSDTKQRKSTTDGPTHYPPTGIQAALDEAYRDDAALMKPTQDQSKQSDDGVCSCRIA